MLVSHKNVAHSVLLNRDLSVLMEAYDRLSGAIAKRTGFNSLCASVPSMVRSRMPRRERRFAELAHLPVRAHRMILSEGTLVEISRFLRKVEGRGTLFCEASEHDPTAEPDARE